MEQHKQAPTLRELERRSLDSIKALNPTDKPFTVYWNGYAHVVPAHGSKIMQRYVFENYQKHFTDEYLIRELDEATKAENKRRIDSAHAVMTAQEQEVFEAKYRINDPDKRREILKKIYGGVVEHYGFDLPSETLVHKPRDTRPVDEQLLEELEQMSAPAVEIPKTETAPDVVVEDKKEELLNQLQSNL